MTVGKTENRKSKFFTYLEKHGLVGDLRTWKHVETEGPCKVFLGLAAPMEGADSYLIGSKLLDLKLDFLIPLLHCIVFVVSVVLPYIVACKERQRSHKTRSTNFYAAHRAAGKMGVSAKLT